LYLCKKNAGSPLRGRGLKFYLFGKCSGNTLPVKEIASAIRVSHNTQFLHSFYLKQNHIMNSTIITLAQKDSIHRVVKFFMEEERNSVMSDIRDEDIVDNFDDLTDDEFYNLYEAKYGHIWFDLYNLSKIQ
jgi:hypothetical protein